MSAALPRTRVNPDNKASRAPNDGVRKIVFRPKDVPENVAQALREYRTWVGARGGKYGGEMSDSTIRRYRETARRLLGKCGIDGLTAEKVKLFVLAETEGLSVGTYNHYIDAVRKYAAFVVRDDEDAEFAKFYKPKLMHRKKQSARARKVYKPLPREELDATVKIARARGDEAFALYLEVAWDPLGRANEVLSLKVGDFDFETSEYGDAVVTFAFTKTGESQPGYIWTPGLAERIQDWFETRRAGPKDFAFPGVRSTSPELKQFADGSIKYHTAAHRFKKYYATSNLPKKLKHSLHNIRAGCAVFLDSQGYSKNSIMHLGRWDSVASLSRYIREEATVIQGDMERGRNAWLAREAPKVEVETPKASKSLADEARELREMGFTNAEIATMLSAQRRTA